VRGKRGNIIEWYCEWYHKNCFWIVLSVLSKELLLNGVVRCMTGIVIELYCERCNMKWYWMVLGEVSQNSNCMLL
jgi:hypothetical protein